MISANDSAILKIQQLKSEFDSIFEDGEWWVMERESEKFLEKLDQELLLLPNTPETICELYAWEAVLNFILDKTKSTKEASETNRIKYTKRKSIRDKLKKFRDSLAAANISAQEEFEKEKETKLTLKRQILLLKALGILELEHLKNLTETKQATLYSNLLGYSKNTTRTILSNIDKKEQDPEHTIFKSENIEKVNELLQSVGLQRFKIA